MLERFAVVTAGSLSVTITYESFLLRLQPGPGSSIFTAHHHAETAFFCAINGQSHLGRELEYHSVRWIKTDRLIDVVFGTPFEEQGAILRTSAYPNLVTVHFFP